ncbi:MAG: CoA-binding protein, partial [Leeuwenhoekiella sp.]
MNVKKTLVIGASLKPHRYSHLAIQRLVKHNQPVVAIGLRKGAVNNVVIEVDKPAFK